MCRPCGSRKPGYYVPAPVFLLSNRELYFDCIDRAQLPQSMVFGPILGPPNW